VLIGSALFVGCALDGRRGCTLAGRCICALEGRVGVRPAAMRAAGGSAAVGCPAATQRRAEGCWGISGALVSCAVLGAEPEAHAFFLKLKVLRLAGGP